VCGGWSASPGILTVGRRESCDRAGPEKPLSPESSEGLVRGKTLTVVKLRLVNVGGSYLSHADVPPLSTALTEKGAGLGSFVSMGLTETVVPGCVEKKSMLEFSATGATVDACVVFFGEPNDPLASISYAAEPYGGSKAITWKVTA
jgi:hypothetical protein